PAPDHRRETRSAPRASGSQAAARAAKASRLSARTGCRQTPHSPQRLQFAGQRIGPLRDGTGPETYDRIAGPGETLDDAGEAGGFRQRDHLAMAVCAQACNEMLAVDAFDRRLAGGIDLGHDDAVGVVEAGAELLEQRLQPRVAMWLYHGDDLAV